MTKKTLLAAAIVAATAGTAAAGGSAGSIGVGAEFQLSGLGGPSVNYDAGAFHAGGFVALEDQPGDDNTQFAVGGRFYYHVASTAMSDFSIGGSLGLGVLDQPAPADSATLLFIEPGIQVRVFLAANVALSLTAGFSIGAADADGLQLTGDTVGGAGFHYYFF